MCPLCIATGSLVLAGASSAGGLAAITAKLLRIKGERGKDNAGSVARSGMSPQRRRDLCVVPTSVPGNDYAAK